MGVTSTSLFQHALNETKAWMEKEIMCHYHTYCQIKLNYTKHFFFPVDCLMFIAGMHKTNKSVLQTSLITNLSKTFACKNGNVLKNGQFDIITTSQYQKLTKFVADDYSNS